MVGQHLEGARIKLLRTDLVRGSVCAGAASRANSSERIVRASFLPFIRSRSFLGPFLPQRDRVYTHAYANATPRQRVAENRARNPRIESSIGGTRNGQATENSP